MPDEDRRDFTVDVKDVAGQIVWRITPSAGRGKPLPRLNSKHLTKSRKLRVSAVYLVPKMVDTKQKSARQKRAL